MNVRKKGRPLFRKKGRPLFRKKGKPLYRHPMNDHLAKHGYLGVELILIIVIVVLSAALSTVIIPKLLSPLESNCRQLDKYCPQ